MQQLTGIVLPSIKGYILTNLLLISLWTFNDFGPFLLIGGGLGRRTQVLPVFMYTEAFTGPNRARLRLGDRRDHPGHQPRRSPPSTSAPDAQPPMKAKAFASRVAFAGFAVAGRRVLRPADAVAGVRAVQRQADAAAPSRRAPTLGNFREVFERDDVLPALRNSVILVVGAVAIVIAVGAPASYALSRIRFPGRDLFLYLLLLLSSVITGAGGDPAAVPA